MKQKMGFDKISDLDELRKMVAFLKEKIELLESSKKALYDLLFKEHRPVCPKCHSTSINRNGKYKGKQNYICKECKKKFSGLTNSLFHHTHLSFKHIEQCFECLIHLFSIRKTARIMKVSTKTIFTVRHKIMSVLKEIINSFRLKGEVKLDEYYLSINLKGTRKEKMPRASKKRTSHGKKKRGINRHKVCVVSGCDEFDNMFFTVAGTGPVTINMIDEYVVPKIGNTSQVITDCKSSYESIAKEKGWNLKQIKSGTYIDEDNNNLSEINSLHQQLEIYLSNFRGVSTKHLQQYLDLFCFLKYLNWTVDYHDQLIEFRNKICVKNTEINYLNVCDNYSILNFDDIYKNYNFHPPKTTT